MNWSSLASSLITFSRPVNQNVGPSLHHNAWPPPIPQTWSRALTPILTRLLAVSCSPWNICMAPGVKQTVMYSQACSLRQPFIPQTSLTGDDGAFDEDHLSPQHRLQSCQHSAETPPLPTVTFSGDPACNPATMAVYLLLSSLKTSLLVSAHL